MKQLKNKIIGLFYIIVVLTLISFNAGCLPKYKITYKLDDIEVRRIEQLSGIVLDIQPFEDIRKSVPGSDILFSSGREAKIEGERYCINSEKGYKQGTVPLQIATVIAYHLRKRGTFKSVTVNNKESADFYLTGKIKRFYGAQEHSMASAIGIQFGLIGALLVKDLKTDGKTEIELIDLAIYKNDGTSIGEINDLHHKYEGELSIDPYCINVYQHVNDNLKTITNKLVEKIERTFLAYFQNIKK